MEQISPTNTMSYFTPLSSPHSMAYLLERSQSLAQYLKHNKNLSFFPILLSWDLEPLCALLRAFSRPECRSRYVTETEAEVTTDG
ncbi:hypothetical protein QE152_g20011 [Popillia japonica]|uniref:Uncharacterized protein n=1 Tax=Popillia japonica TaxID=7064 RepID=A0AAW1KM70_POPJA